MVAMPSPGAGNAFVEGARPNGGQGRLYQFQGKTFYDAVIPNDKQGMKDWFSGNVREMSLAVEVGCTPEIKSLLP